MNKCTIENCEKESKSKGLCWSHYKKQQIENNPEKYREYMKKYMSNDIQKEKTKQYTQSDSYKKIKKISDKKYYEKNKEKIWEYQKKYREQRI